MRSPLKSFLAYFAGGLALVLASALGGQAFAASGSCGCGPTTPPTPHVPQININVTVGAQAGGSANAAGSAFGASSLGGGGGGGGFFSGPGTLSVISNLSVDGGERTRVAYEADRTTTKKVVIQAFCLEDKDVPHPASQLAPDRDIEDAYDGEIYRCIAGTHMQYTIAAFDGRIDFAHGQTLSCQKGDALYHSPGGRLDCRPQKPARDCNERSLLRRFGAGVKVLTMVTVEKYTAYREETRQSASSGTLSLDGGVGGVVY